MTDARIYQTDKNAMQSGRARAGIWVLEYEPTGPKHVDPLTGWAGSGFTREQLKLEFPTLEAAQDYATRQGLTVRVLPTPPRKLKIQSYADNFK